MTNLDTMTVQDLRTLARTIPACAGSWIACASKGVLIRAIAASGYTPPATAESAPSLGAVSPLPTSSAPSDAPRCPTTGDLPEPAPTPTPAPIAQHEPAQRATGASDRAASPADDLAAALMRLMDRGSASSDFDALREDVIALAGRLETLESTIAAAADVLAARR